MPAVHRQYATGQVRTQVSPPGTSFSSLPSLPYVRLSLSSLLAAHCTCSARRVPCADDASSSVISVMCSILRLRQPSAVLLSFSRPTHPDHVLRAFHGAWTPHANNEAQSELEWLGLRAHTGVYTLVFCSLVVPLLRTESNFVSLAKLFGRPRRPYSILVYTTLPREHARLHHYPRSDIPSDTPARLLQCLCLRLWTSPEQLRIHACLEISAAPPQRVSCSHLNLCTLAYRLSSLGFIRPMHETRHTRSLAHLIPRSHACSSASTDRPCITGRLCPVRLDLPRSTSPQPLSPDSRARDVHGRMHLSMDSLRLLPSAHGPLPLCSSASMFLCPCAHPTSQTTSPKSRHPAVPTPRRPHMHARAQYILNTSDLPKRRSTLPSLSLSPLPVPAPSIRYLTGARTPQRSHGGITHMHPSSLSLHYTLLLHTDFRSPLHTPLPTNRYLHACTHSVGSPRCIFLPTIGLGPQGH